MRKLIYITGFKAISIKKILNYKAINIELHI